MSFIQVEVKNSASVADVLSRISERTKNLRPAMQDIGAMLRTDALDNFKNQHDPDGNAWAPLKPSTILARARRLSGGKGIRKKDGSLRSNAVRTISGAKILQDRGTLRSSISVQNVTANSVTVGTKIAYAAIHQFGGQTGRGRKVRIPARPYIGITQSASKDIVSMLQTYLVEGM